MMIKKIATVAVYTDDQQKAKTFWTEKAGLKPSPSIRWDRAPSGLR